MKTHAVAGIREDGRVQVTICGLPQWTRPSVYVQTRFSDGSRRLMNDTFGFLDSDRPEVRAALDEVS